MEIKYFKHYSSNLYKDIEFKTYGNSDNVFIYFPTQYQRFYEIEDKGLINELSSLIESNKMMIISVDSVDQESISSTYWDKHALLNRQEQYFHYIIDEFYPYIKYLFNFEKLPTLIGMSFGAYQAMNIFLRKPMLFSGVFAMSGIYDIRFFTNNYFDELAFYNSPIDSIRMLNNHEYLNIIKQKNIVAVVSNGAYEDINQTIDLDKAFKDKGIYNAEFYYWSDKYSHDWPSWFTYINFYINKFII